MHGIPNARSSQRKSRSRNSESESSHDSWDPKVLENLGVPQNAQMHAVTPAVSASEIREFVNLFNEPLSQHAGATDTGAGVQEQPGLAIAPNSYRVTVNVVQVRYDRDEENNNPPPPPAPTVEQLRRARWEAMTRCYRSNNGINGGVYFTRVPDLPFDILFKAPDEPRHEVFGMRFAERLGLRVPVTALLDQEAGNRFREGLENCPDIGNIDRNEVRNRLNALNRYVAMEEIHGTNLTNAGQVARFLADPETRDEMLRSFGRMLALDFLLLNRDRLPSGRGADINRENMMVETDDRDQFLTMVPIDQALNYPDGDYHEQIMDYIRDMNRLAPESIEGYVATRNNRDRILDEAINDERFCDWTWITNIPLRLVFALADNIGGRALLTQIRNGQESHTGSHEENQIATAIYFANQILKGYQEVRDSAREITNEDIDALAEELDIEPDDDAIIGLKDRLAAMQNPDNESVDGEEDDEA